jgi:DNA-binding NtrC family response regulator
MVLIVDDDPIFLGNATVTLTSAGERVLCAPDAERALDLVSRIGSEFGIALIDLDLRESSGFDLITDIKKLDMDLPIIAISGVLSVAALESARVFGVEGLLRKPPGTEWNNEIARLRRHPEAKRKLAQP